MRHTPVYRFRAGFIDPALGLLLALVLGITPAARAAVSLPGIFSDHMVLQRDEPVPVWGFAEPGEKVTVSIGEQRLETQADEQGRWRVDVEPMGAGGPFTLTIKGDNTVSIEDVYVGEVWLCSGQSNMGWRVANTVNAEAEMADADRPMIRMYTAAHTLSAEPQPDVEGSWQVCSPETVGDFSAVAYYFGRKLSDELDVPIGLVHSSWGGSRAEPWVTREALLSHADYAAQVEQIDEQRAAYLADKQKAEAEYQAALPVYKQAFADWGVQVAEGGKGMQDGWATDPGDDAQWQTMQLPGYFEMSEVSGLASFDGVVWFRRFVDIPEDWAGHALTISFGAIDDIDLTFFNGEPVGHIGMDQDWYWSLPRRYEIPAELVKAGRAEIVVRVADLGGAGGFSGDPEHMSLVPTDVGDAEPISLAGEWKFRIDTPLDGFAPRPTEPTDPATIGTAFRSPMAMYNAMIHPLVPYGLRGAIWYQGESNAGQAQAYRELLPLLIESWRDVWQKPDMPFGIVQLANFTRSRFQPAESNWAELRDAQLNTFRNDPNAGLAVTIDIGDANDIHPRNKQDVGKRLALWALARVYGYDLVWSGPIYQSMQIKDGKVYLTFDHVGGGLQARDGGTLHGFSVAGEDHKFVWAEAEVVGDRIVVYSEQVPEPMAVRYAWAHNPDNADLVNAQGLPASPFRTDDWPGITTGFK